MGDILTSELAGGNPLGVSPEGGPLWLKPADPAGHGRKRIHPLGGTSASVGMGTVKSCRA